MFKHLLLQLALMYPLAGLALILLLGGGGYLLIRTYMLIDYYPNVELEGCMAAEFEKLGVSLPEELQAARQRLEHNQVTGRPRPACDESTLFVLYLDEEGRLFEAGGTAQPRPGPANIQDAGGHPSPVPDLSPARRRGRGHVPANRTVADRPGSGRQPPSSPVAGPGRLRRAGSCPV